MNQEQRNSILSGSWRKRTIQPVLFEVPKQENPEIRKTLWDGIYIHINEYNDEVPILENGNKITSFNGLT